MVEAVMRPIALDEQQHQVGASVGIARFPQDAAELSQLLHCADLALYRAKRVERGTFAFFGDLPSRPLSVFSAL